MLQQRASSMEPSEQQCNNCCVYVRIIPHSFAVIDTLHYVYRQYLDLMFSILVLLCVSPREIILYYCFSACLLSTEAASRESLKASQFKMEIGHVTNVWRLSCCSAVRRRAVMNNNHNVAKGGPLVEEDSPNLRVSTDIIVRQNIFKKLSARLPDNQQLHSYKLFHRFLKNSNDKEEKIMDYDSYRSFVEYIQPNNRPSSSVSPLFFENVAFLSPSSFLRLPRTADECLKDTTLWYYCSRKHLAMQFLLKLALFYCEDSTGIISEASFQAFVENEMIESCPELKNKMNPSFYPYYSCTVSRKVCTAFLFIVDLNHFYRFSSF